MRTTGTITDALDELTIIHTLTGLERWRKRWVGARGILRDRSTADLATGIDEMLSQYERIRAAQQPHE